MPAPARPLLTAGKLPPDAHAPAVIEFVDTFHSSVRAAPPVPAKPIAVMATETSASISVNAFLLFNLRVESREESSRSENRNHTLNAFETSA